MFNLYYRFICVKKNEDNIELIVTKLLLPAATKVKTIVKYVKKSQRCTCTRIVIQGVNTDCML